MLSGLTQFCGSMGVNGFEEGLWRGTTAADARVSIALPHTAIETPEPFIAAIESSKTLLAVKEASGYTGRGEETKCEDSRGAGAEDLCTENIRTAVARRKLVAIKAASFVADNRRNQRQRCSACGSTIYSTACWS